MNIHSSPIKTWYVDGECVLSSHHRIEESGALRFYNHSTHGSLSKGFWSEEQLVSVFAAGQWKRLDAETEEASA